MREGKWREIFEKRFEAVLTSPTFANIYIWALLNDYKNTLMPM